MLFRQSGQSADRRRRVLTDGVLGTAAVPQKSVSKSRKEDQETYTEAAHPENQPAITEMMPTRRWVLAVLFLLGVSLAAGVLAVQSGVPDLAIAAPLHNTTLDSLPRESMAAWFSSMAFAVAAFGAWVIYLVRRHRQDDYRGRYRVWLWTGLFWLFLSADETAGFHDSYVALASHITGWQVAGDGAAWWLAAWGLVFGAFVVRLLFELKRCKSAMASLIIAATLWSLTAALRLGWQPSLSISLGLVASGAKLLGLVFLLLTTGLYARHVILDSQGLLPRRKPKEPKPAKTDRKTAAGTTQTRVDSAHDAGSSGSRPATATPPTTPSWQRPSTPHSSSSGSYDAGDEEDGGRRLSKAERKRLRREQRQATRKDDDWV